jgi:hypothetical protein
VLFFALRWLAAICRARAMLNLQHHWTMLGTTVCGQYTIGVLQKLVCKASAIFGNHAKGLVPPVLRGLQHAIGFFEVVRAPSIGFRLSCEQVEPGFL